MEFPDKNALRMWLLEVLEAHEDAASAYVEQAARGELVSVNYYMSEDDVRKLGFIEPGKPLTLPSLPI